MSNLLSGLLASKAAFAPFLILTAAAVAVVIAKKVIRRSIATRRGTQPSHVRIPPSTITARRIVSANEFGMYIKLVEAFPEYFVLTQVSFQALVDAGPQEVRNSFNQKYTDFVICTKTLDIVCIIELDDPSHSGRYHQDKHREEILTNAGYKVLRYKQIPPLETLYTDMESILRLEAMTT